MPFDEQAAIEDFWNARARGEYFPAQWFDRLTLDQAYRIQLGVMARRDRRGRAADRLEGGADGGADPAAVRLP